MEIVLLAEGWDTITKSWRDKEKKDLRVKTRGTDPRDHFPEWVWDAVRDVAVLVATGTWPREGGKKRQTAPFLKLVNDLSDLGFLKAARSTL